MLNGERLPGGPDRRNDGVFAFVCAYYAASKVHRRPQRTFVRIAILLLALRPVRYFEKGFGGGTGAFPSPLFRLGGVAGALRFGLRSLFFFGSTGGLGRTFFVAAAAAAAAVVFRDASENAGGSFREDECLASSCHHFLPAAFVPNLD